MAKLVMGYWDCPFCGSKGIRGDVTNCPSCGRARGDVQFYMKDYTEGEIREENERADVEYLTEEQAKYVSENPDWYCSFCNSLNSDNAESCGNCGASRKDSESNYFEMLAKMREREAAEAAAQQPAAGKKRRSPLLVILAVLAVIVGFFMWMNGDKTNGDLKVTSVSWVRSIAVEENRLFSESDWTLPAGAEQTDAREELHHYDAVLDHMENVEVRRSRQVIDHYETYYTYEDNGNGTFSEVPHERPVYGTEYYTETVQQPVYVNVPRYQTKYYYNIWRWTQSRDVIAAGEDHNAAWPEITLAENEREGARTEVYRFTVDSVKKAGDTATYRLAESDWRNVSVGDQIFITARRTGSEPFISDEKGNKIADLVRER